MKVKYRTIEHTADIGLVAWGEDLSEAFLNAAIGMSSIMVDLRTVRADVCVDVTIEEENLENLLFEWLNQLLYYFDTRGIIFKTFKLVSFSSSRLEVNCYGEVFDPERHTIKTGIKSATFHRLLVDRKNNQAQVFLDL